MSRWIREGTACRVFQCTSGQGKGKSMKTLKDAEKVTPVELRGMKPSQIDELFYLVYAEQYRLDMAKLRAWDRLHSAVGDKKNQWGRWALPRVSVWDTAEKATDPDTVKAWERMEELVRKDIALAAGPAQVLDDEFRRRGGWTRAYLVTDGHVHRSQECSSCHKGEYRTRFSWMIAYSGKSMAEIIEAAGHRACTICYPDAPVAKGEKAPESVMFTEEERERATQREADRIKREAKKAKAAEGAITDVDGSPLYDKAPGERFRSVVKTLRTARMELTDEVWYRDNYNHPEDHTKNIDYLAPAIAKKEGKDVATVIREAEVRAKKRR